MSTHTEPRRSTPFRDGLIVMGGMLAVMWVLEIIDVASAHSLDQYGIVPRRVDQLLHLLSAPWLHYGWGHLMSNTLPFLVLGMVTWLSGFREWLTVTVLSLLGSGLLVWLIAPNATITAGASGLVFGYLAYLLVRGFFRRNGWQILIAVIVFAFYGTALFGVIPGAAGISWQGHLGGALGGVLAAWLPTRGTRTLR
ncbi:rhomboid family intramembrane serine protease [Arachnia propionica]|uniref:Rhomboid family intramembrane serine protease n=1 Tax=Arachnia propionica TaxID=1750 RepID=A0A3P1T3J2_9ACTN|nr:rhomboid family intramembrane serine protease [Arachnia propionica]MDO5082618.1 rhomboid family intramembrane serine protease [Arachnia propionica]RRD03725.1 rhomboid family intramembrane serine protease [Arachnia propionica]